MHCDFILQMRNGGVPRLRVLLMHGLETAEDGGPKASALRAGT